MKPKKDCYIVLRAGFTLVEGHHPEIHSVHDTKDGALKCACLIIEDYKTLGFDMRPYWKGTILAQGTNQLDEYAAVYIRKETIKEKERK